MADIQAQISTARNAGYDDAAIAQHLDTMPEYSGKVSAALKAGYAPTDIIKFLATPKTLLSQIPGAENAPAPKAEATPSLYQRVLGAAEVPIGMLGSAIAAPIAGAAGIVSNLTSGKFGTQEGLRIADETRQRVQRKLYQPVTETGAQNLQAVGQVLEPLMGVPIPTMNALAQGVAAPLRMGTNAMRAAAEPVGAALQRRQNTLAAGKVAESYQNAPKIEAAQTAQKLGLALNPSISNPTAATRAISAVGGVEADTKLAQGNIVKTVNLIKEDIGLKPTDSLNASTIDKALNAQSKPYDVVRALPALTVPDEVVQTLNTVRQPALIGGGPAATAVNSLVDDALGKLQAGRSGALVLDDIRQLRREAQVVYKARDRGTNPKPDEVARADAQMKIADTLEQVLEANVKNPGDVAAMRAARVRMAQTYDHLRALDFATGQIDPQAYVKMLNERQGQMTGVGADIAKVAANYPSVMTVATAEPFGLPRIVRGSLGATVGGALGSLGGPLGIGAGMATGIATGAAAGNLAARRMATPAFQAKYAMPPDYRAPVANALAPTPPNTLPVPFASQGTVLPGAEAPNWVYGRAGAPDPNLQTGIPPGAPQLAAPSAEATMARVAQQRAYELARDRAAAAQASQAAETQAAATQLPTGRGTLLDFDPITGRLRNASQGMVGATPDTILSAGYPLSSAVEKVSSGRNFALTAEEKIAWGKTRVDLADAVPGFNKLSDKAILGKMQDRAWVADAVQKARDQAKGFAEIGRRSNDQIVSARAAAESARMMNLAESLEESLRARPVEMKNRSQGPKTRAARRNELAPEDAVIVTPSNALRP